MKLVRVRDEDQTYRVEPLIRCYIRGLRWNVGVTEDLEDEIIGLCIFEPPRWILFDRKVVTSGDWVKIWWLMAHELSHASFEGMQVANRRNHRKIDRFSDAIAMAADGAVRGRKTLTFRGYRRTHTVSLKDPLPAILAGIVQRYWHYKVAGVGEAWDFARCFTKIQGAILARYYKVKDAKKKAAACWRRYRN